MKHYVRQQVSAGGVQMHLLVCGPARGRKAASRQWEASPCESSVMRVRESSVYYENVFTRSRPKNVHQPWPRALKLESLFW